MRKGDQGIRFKGYNTLKKNHVVFLGIALVGFILDQIAKLIIVANIDPHQSVQVIPGFFNIVFVRNKGMAFGVFSHINSTLFHYLLLSVIIVAIGAIVFFLFTVKKNQAWMGSGLSLILGGALGNLADRIRLGYVIDFLDFGLKNYHWPAFNMADSIVTAGTFCVLIEIIKRKN